MKFSYFWHRPTIDFKLSADLGYFLAPEYIPELYDLNQRAYYEDLLPFAVLLLP